MSSEAITMLALTPDGELVDVTATNQGNTLAALYEAIGCDYVEVVRLPDGLDMWMDEEGALKPDAEMNLFAMAVAGSLAERFVRQAFVGTVVFAGVRRDSTVSISADARQWITELVGTLLLL